MSTYVSKKQYLKMLNELQRSIKGMLGTIPPVPKSRIATLLAYGNLLLKLDVIDMHDLRNFSDAINKHIDFLWDGHEHD